MAKQEMVFAAGLVKAARQAGYILYLEEEESGVTTLIIRDIANRNLALEVQDAILSCKRHVSAYLKMEESVVVKAAINIIDRKK